MKIILLKTHENVNIGGKYANNFSVDVRPGREAVEMTLIEEINAIEVKTASDHIMIPMVNIAFFKLESAASVKKAEAKAKEAAKPKSNIKAGDIKRPR